MGFWKSLRMQLLYDVAKRAFIGVLLAERDAQDEHNKR
jgi:hypothetical protein